MHDKHERRGKKVVAFGNKKRSHIAVLVVNVAPGSSSQRIRFLLFYSCVTWEKGERVYFNSKHDIFLSLTKLTEKDIC